MKNKVRIGIILTDFKVESWAFRMLEMINNNPNSEIVLALIIKRKSGKKINQLQKYPDPYLYHLYQKIDRFLYKCNPDAFSLKELEFLKGINQVLIQYETKYLKDNLDQKRISEIQDNDLDILINLSPQEAVVEENNIPEITKYGIWSYYHGDSDVFRYGPPGFWEVMEKNPETGVMLQIYLNNSVGVYTIYKSTSLTDTRSTIRNKNSYYWKAVSYLPEKIEELYNLGSETFINNIKRLNIHPKIYSNKFYTVPSNFKMISIFLSIFLDKLKNLIKNIFYFQQWIILYKINAIQNPLTPMHEYVKIIPPKDRLWADPHVIERNGKYYIFIEELIFKKNIGHISVIEMDSDGKYSNPVMVLEKDYHLSYPFLIENSGELFMIPESLANNNIQLYRCTDFPLKWELEIVLIDNIKAVDTTILYKDGRYWLFANVIRNSGGSSFDELFLFYSEKLVSNKWKSHPSNPVVSDVKKSRPAGKIFEYNGNLYRPSQNCSNLYGYGMTINCIKKINENTYEETVVDSIFPNWDSKIKGTHTINFSDKLNVIDGLMNRNIFF